MGGQLTCQAEDETGCNKMIDEEPHGYLMFSDYLKRNCALQYHHSEC